METDTSTEEDVAVAAGGGGGVPLHHSSSNRDDDDDDDEDQDEYHEEGVYDVIDDGVYDEVVTGRRHHALMRELEDDDEDDDDDEDGDNDDDDEEEEEQGGEEEADRVFSRDNSSSSDTAAGGGSGSGGKGKINTDFEASLLLHIGTSVAESNTNPAPVEREEQQRLLRERGSGSEIIHDPTTLPTSMTSFLDILTEEQRRVRHRHIPAVDGFRRLYKSEIKSDITLARRSCRKKLQQRWSSHNSKRSSDECVDDSTTPMDVDENVHVSESNNEIGDEEVEEGIADDNEEDTENSRETIHEENEQDVAINDNIEDSCCTNLKNTVVSDAFIEPTREARQCALGGQLANLLENTDFENAIGNGNDAFMTSSKKTKASAASSSSTSTSVLPLIIARSPKLVDSLTTFNPPRPQESTTLKTLHRMKRWEANPSEIEVDLRNYRKTVCRTQEELHNAEEERLRVESVASLMRNHFMEHLKNYHAEVMAINEGLENMNDRCCTLLDDKHLQMRNSTATTRGGGGGSGKGMADVLATLKALGEKGAGIDVDKKGDTPMDWRRKGVGGISAEAYGAAGHEERAKDTMLAKGWLLVGDEVIVTSTGEEGIVVSIDDITMKAGESSETGYSSVETEVKQENKKENQPTLTTSPLPTDTDAMNVDKPLITEKEKEVVSAIKKEGGATPSPSVSEDTKPYSLVKPRSIGIKLTKSGHIQTYTLAEIEFNPYKSPTLFNMSDSALARRWECMINTALVNSAGHDILAMEEYINSFFVGENVHDADANETDDGTASPKSVTLYHDERTLLPFGSGLVPAPEVVNNGPSVIPLDNLEETVRKMVYGMDTPRIIPTMPPTLLPYESRKEEMNALKGKVLQLRNRLGRQKRLRSLNEHSLIAGKSRANKVERLLKEMEKDLITLKERLQDELNELGIGNSATNLALVNDSMHVDETEGCTTTLYAAEGSPEELL